MIACGVVAADERLPLRTPLDDYIQKPDASYSWKVVSSKSVGGMKSVVVEMVSQTWRTKEEVDRPQWQHWVTLAFPEKITSDIGMLFIGGGRNGGDPPERGGRANDGKIPQATGSCVAELKMVPNQPLVFHNDGKPCVEDDLIGYTWDQYIKTGDPSWPARNPMIKNRCSRNGHDDCRHGIGHGWWAESRTLCCRGRVKTRMDDLAHGCAG